MTIKSDKWIRRMALEKKMIEPFVEKQVRKGVVSYGLSSYGYDLRVADEFKIFTNINSTIVDPKVFDESSFVNVKGNCIIPPNSFALARTVEYLRIPRNVLTVCLGKCLTGDTRVVDADTGDYLPIAEFAGRGRTLGLDGLRLAPLAVTDFIPQGVKPVFRLTTRSGLQLRATANHPFRQRHGWTRLDELRAGDAIATVRELPLFGRGSLEDVEALAGRLEHGVAPVVFRADREGVAAFLRALFTRRARLASGDRGAAVELAPLTRRAADDVRHLLARFGVVAFTREAQGACALELADQAMVRRLLERVGFAVGSDMATRADAWLAEGRFGRTVIAHDTDVVWDVVERIEPAGEEEVFDLTVPGAENFVANLTICHNSTYARCGIVVNVTPFEPEWEGHATLEISNTTPLPARIYGNEGLCQVLFFESDEDCETSYADKAGKYQGQGPEIVLPRM